MSSPQRDPTSFYGMPDERHSPYFRALGREVGGSANPRLRSVPHLIKNRTGRTRIKQLFILTADQFQTYLRECEVDATYITIVEDHLGGKFKTLELPDERVRPLTGPVTSEEVIQSMVEEEEEKLKCDRGKLCTLTRQLGVTVYDICIPAAMLSCITTKNPKLVRISDAEFFATCNMWAA